MAGLTWRQDRDQFLMLVQTESGSCLRPSSPRPLLHSGIVSRERLFRRLDENDTRKLSVVVAPAGWGKTTLLAEWARRTRDRQPVAWLTLDETDDEPQRFWTYVVTALLTTTPGLGDAALVALRVPGIDPIDVALPALLNDLSGTDAKQTLILDDYHMLTDARIHEGVEYLLSYLPPSLRLVIAGRLDPPLPLARMRAAVSSPRSGPLICGSARRRPPASSRRYPRLTPARTWWTRWWTAKAGRSASNWPR